MRLIDADRLNEEIKSKFGYSSATAFVRSMQDLSQVEVFRHIMRLIEAAPTIASDEDIKNFTLYNYPLKPGCTLLTDDDKADSGLLEEGEE